MMCLPFRIQCFRLQGQLRKDHDMENDAEAIRLICMPPTDSEKGMKRGRIYFKSQTRFEYRAKVQLTAEITVLK